MTASDSMAARSPSRVRARGTFVAGIAIILLSAGAALLPAEDGISSDVIGVLLLAAGLIELVAGSLRRETRILAMAAGGITAAAGLLFVIDQQARFIPTVNIIIAWLVLRSIALAVASQRTDGSVRRWTLIAAATDFLLGIILLVGLSLATIVILLFGPTPAIVATFSWIVALSLVTTGLLMLEIASCERSVAESAHH
ncbi:MAG TPA: hypothetical protein VM265_03290 [Sphingomicrobium sp.]|nr:hypothetical protein [Sphingomicrobium sp.]